MIDENKLKKVYGTLQQGGYAEDYNTFKSGFTGNSNYANRKKVYDLLSQNGADIGNTYEEFMDLMQKPKSGANKSAMNGLGSHGISPYIERNDGIVKESRKKLLNSLSDFSQRAINHAKHSSSLSGKREPVRYTDTHEAITPLKNMQDAEREYAEAVTNDWRKSQVKAEQLYQERERLNEALRKRVEEIDNRDGQGGADFIRKSAAALTPGGGLIGESDADMRKYNVDPEYVALTSALRKNQAAIQTLEDAKNGDTDSFWHTFFTTFANGYTYGGGQSEFDDVKALMYAKQRMDSMNRKRVSGIPLDREERVAKAVMDNTQANDIVQSIYGEMYGPWASAGATTATSVDFMTDILTNPGVGNVAKATYKGIAGLGAKQLAKKVGDNVVKNISKDMARGILKATGVLVGAHTAGAYNANTTAINKTLGMAAKNTVGTAGKDKDGDYKLVDGMNAMKAFLDAERNQVREYGSEAFGELLPGFGKPAMKMLEKVGLSKISNFFNTIGSKEWYKQYNAILERGGYNGLPKEALEEYEGMGFDAFTGHAQETWDSLKDSRTHIDIWLGVGAQSVLLGAVPMLRAGFHVGNYYKYKSKVAIADSAASKIIGDEKWNELRSQIDATDNKHMASMLDKILQMEELGKEGRDYALRYGRDLSKMRFYNIAAANNAAEGANKAPKVEEQEQAYAEGQNAEGEKKHEIQQQAAEAESWLASLLGVSEEQLESVDLDSMLGENDELDSAIYEYQNAQARYKGVTDKAQSKVDAAEQNAIAEVKRRTDTSRGTVRNATIKSASNDLNGGEDYGVFILSGNIVQNEDGTINISDSDQMILYFDPLTGKIEHGDASRFASLGEEVDAELTAQQAAELAKQKAIEEVSAEIDGKVGLGSRFVVTDNQGQQHVYEVLADNGDGTASISIDGNVMENVLPSFDELQKMKDDSEKQVIANNVATRQANREKQKKEEELVNKKYSQITDQETGMVIPVTVKDELGNDKYVDAKGVFLVKGMSKDGKKAPTLRFVVVDEEGNITPDFANKKFVSIGKPISLDEFKGSSDLFTVQENNEETPSDTTLAAPSTDEGSRAVAPDEASDGKDNKESLNNNEEKQTLTFADGTPIPLGTDGYADLSQMTPEQTAEWLDVNLGDDAQGVIEANVLNARKALDKANGTSIKPSNTSEMVKAKQAKQAAIEAAKQTYDKAIEIQKAYNERRKAAATKEVEGSGLVDETPIEENEPAAAPITDEEADAIIADMESRAEPAADIPLTPENWVKEFGEEGTVQTPIGVVKMGENQVAKLFDKKRSKEFGMIRPTLENPDVIIEVPSTAVDGNEERPSSYLFVKTFLGKNGKKIYYFKSVTIKKEGLEISISSHYDRANRVKEDLKKGKLLYRVYGGAQTEQTQPSASVTTSQEGNAGSSDGKDNKKSSNGNEEKQTLTFNDGTPVPMLEDGNPDFSKMTAEQTAELYDSQFGDDAEQILSTSVAEAKKVLDKAKGKPIKGKTFIEQKASKEANDKVVADSQTAYDNAKAVMNAYQEMLIDRSLGSAEGRSNLLDKAKRKFDRLKNTAEYKDDAAKQRELWNDTVGKVLHRLYDSTSVDVFDPEPRTVEEYVSSNLAPYSLNYEGTKTAKGVKQETGLERKDFAMSHILAAEGKGQTVDSFVHKLWENRPHQLENATDQDVRNAVIGLITGNMNAYDMRHVIENNRIAEAEKEIEDEQTAAENAAYQEEQRKKAEDNAPSEEEQAEYDAETEAMKNDATLREMRRQANKDFEDAENDEEQQPEQQLPEEDADNMPFGEQLNESDLPFSTNEENKVVGSEERKDMVNKNKVTVDHISDAFIPEKLQRGIARIAKMMPKVNGKPLTVQYLYSADADGWFDRGTNTLYLALDSSKALQMVFGHEMTHAIKSMNTSAYDELKGLVKEFLGSDFEKAVDATEQFYNAHGVSYQNREDYEEEVIADGIGTIINDLNLTKGIALRMSHPLLAAFHDVLMKIRLAFRLSDDGTYEQLTHAVKVIEKAYIDTAKGTFESNQGENEERVAFSLREKPEPEKKGVGYKVFLLKDGKLYPPMVANPNGTATPVGVWLDADAAPIAGESKTGRPQVKQGGKGTQGGSGMLAYRPGWHLGVIPYALQFNRKDAEGNKTLFPKNFVFAEVEYAADVDYQQEAHDAGINPSGKYQHSLAGLKHLPTDGYYMYRTNPNPETDPWVITGAMKVNRILTRAEQADLVKKAGREPQLIQGGDIVTDEAVNAINQEIANAPKFSLKVYHGSGADFDEFDFDHMGEGAGSQAFGWGGYVTSSKEIGKSYAQSGMQTRTVLVKNNGKWLEFSEGDPMFRVVDEAMYLIKSEGLRGARNFANRWKSDADTEDVRQQWEKVADLLNNHTKADFKSRYPSYLYEVEIPEDNGKNYLDWYETPTDEIIDKVAKALPTFRSFDVKRLKNETGKDLYNVISMRITDDDSVFNDDKAASKFLSSLGFTGIKYPAGTIMGGAKEGDMNYVIFKPEDMKIASHTKFSIRTYHGSQASFDHFDHSFMGSGEGAQAYGWGTYVSEVEGIARAYAKQNVRKRSRGKGGDLHAKLSDAEFKRSLLDSRYNHVVNDIDFQTKNREKKQAILEEELKDRPRLAETYGEGSDIVAETDKIISKLQKILARAENTLVELADRKKGLEKDIADSDKVLADLKAQLEQSGEFPWRNLYTVEIPDDTGDNYIGWDGKVSEKAAANIAKGLVAKDMDAAIDMLDMYGNFIVKADIDKLHKGKDIINKEKMAERLGKAIAGYRGGAVYDDLAEILGGQKAASQFLNGTGFDGVKVIAQRNSGGNKQGNMNYVIFDESNAKIVNHTKFSLRNIEKVNSDFNDALKGFTLDNADKITFNLGMPSDDLLSGGVENKPLKLYGSKLAKKIRKHDFEPSDLIDLPKAMQHPIAVFNNHETEGNRSVLTELKIKGDNVLVSVTIGKGQDADINIISSTHGKRKSSVIEWFKKGFATFVNKKKAQEYLHLAAPIAAASNTDELSAAKISNSSETAKENGENLSSDSDDIKFSIRSFGTDIADASDEIKQLMNNEKNISRRIGSRAQAQNRVLATLSRASDEFGRSNRASARSGQDTWEKDRALGYVVRASYGTGSFLTEEEIKEITSGKVGSGEENQVFLSKDGKTVIKLNNFLMVDKTFRFNEFVDRIKAHNEFAPNDMYIPLGFALNPEGDFCIVLEQPYVDGKPATQEEIDDYLEYHGFDLAPVMVGDGEIGVGWSDGNYEIWDTKPRNVLKDKNGDLHFIDTVIQHTVIDGHNDTVRFSIRNYDFDSEMRNWKKRNHLAEDAKPLEKPEQIEGENIGEYAARMAEYAKDNALWKTAPKPVGYKEALEKWKSEHGLTDFDTRPSRPVKADFDGDEDAYKEAMELYKQEKEKWADAPKPSDFNLQIEVDNVNKRLGNLRKAMLNQKDYDKRTVSAVSGLVNTMLNLGWGDGLSRGKIERLLSAAKNATGAADVKKHLDNAMNILVDNYLGRMESAYEKLTSTKGVRKDQSGVIKIGQLDAKGQVFLEEYNIALVMSDADLQKRMYNLNGDDELDVMRIEAINSAMLYKNTVGGNEADMVSIKGEIDKLNAKEGKSKEDYELMRTLKDKVLENKIDRVKMLSNVLADLQATLSDSKTRAKEFKERIINRKKHIWHLSNLDMQGKDATHYETDNAKKKALRNVVLRTVLSPTYTFEQYLKLFGDKNVKGEGYLYNYFMSEWNDSVDSEQIGKEENRKALDAKAKALFGKGTNFMSLIGLDGKKLDEMDCQVTDVDGEKRTIHLKQGQMLYIYLVNKEIDGAMKLRAMGITDSDVAAIEAKLDPKVKAMGEWLQDEYLPICQRRYQNSHVRFFGAPMKEVDNYFPLLINPRARNINEDVSQDSSAKSQLAGTTTGAIVTRKVNTIPLDIENADAFAVALNHLNEMEEWAAMLPFRQDINTLLSYTRFRNQVTNLSSKAYGNGEASWKQFMQCAQIAAGTYKPKVDNLSMDRKIAKALGMVSMAKISGRLWTAVKQTLSFPAFWTEASPVKLIKNTFNPLGSYKWAKENMPLYRKRIESMTVGDTRINALMDDMEKTHNLFMSIAKKGMLPNIFVDAVTCAVGARSVYETEYEKLKELGYPDDVAEDKAVRKAVLSYNKSQQSSEGAFVAPMQVDRTYVSAALSLYKNSNYAYGRSLIEAARGLGRSYKFWGGHPKYMVEQMKRQIEFEDGLSSDDAEKIARRAYNRAFVHNLGVIFNYLTVVPITWALGRVLPYLFLGDDGDKKMKYIEEAFVKGFATSITDDYAIPFLSDVANSVLEVNDGKLGFNMDGMKNVDLYVNPATSDLANMIGNIANSPWSAASSAGLIGIQALIGFNPQTVGSLVQAFAEFDKSGKDVPTEVKIAVLKAMNAPEANIRDLYMDELGLNDDDAKKFTVDELAERYAERRMNKDVGVGANYVLPKDSYDALVEKYTNSFNKRIQDYLDKMDEADKKKVDSIYNSSVDPGIKEMIGKKRAKDAKAETEERLANEGYVKEEKEDSPAEAEYKKIMGTMDLANDVAMKERASYLRKKYANQTDEYNDLPKNQQYLYLKQHKYYKEFRDIESKNEKISDDIKKLKEKLVNASHDEQKNVMEEIRKLKSQIIENQRMAIDKFVN